jgi:hypothetical protein
VAIQDVFTVLEGNEPTNPQPRNSPERMTLGNLQTILITDNHLVVSMVRWHVIKILPVAFPGQCGKFANVPDNSTQLDGGPGCGLNPYLHPSLFQGLGEKEGEVVKLPHTHDKDLIPRKLRLS